MKAISLFVAFVAVASGTLLAGVVDLSVTVDPADEVGRVKPMNAVNNGPSIPSAAGTQIRGNFDAYAQARFPFARLHDSINCVPGGAHAVDISAIFSNFDADENDPKSYDFEFTDTYLATIHKAGTGIFFRLGQTIEHGTKKYHVFPPTDFAKWARICEHVVRHYNEKWANGFAYGITYWEIWNEPDLRYEGAARKTSQTWQGTPEEFFELYKTTARHLRKCFPSIKVGGPASAGRMEWCERFIANCQTNAVPMDFFSWHVYGVSPEEIARRGCEVRKLLDRYGYVKTESICDEYNYVRGWTDEWVYSMRVESGDLCLKGGAFCAATLCACQDAPVDMLMYYDARVGTVMNGLFDRTTLWPQKPYYAFYPWAKLRDLGTQVAAKVATPKSAFGDAVLRAVAAKDADGKVGVYFARYSEDDADSRLAKLTLRVKGRSLQGATCHLTDDSRLFTEVPLAVGADGSATLVLLPLAYGYVELSPCGDGSCVQQDAAPEGANTLTAQEKAEGYELLFDGKALPSDKWVGVKESFTNFPARGWFVKDGCLTMRPLYGISKDGQWFPLPEEEQRLGGGGDIVTVRKYKDFVFKFDFRLTRAANSGVKYYYDENLNKGTCEEYQVLEAGHPDSDKGKNGNRRVASLYDLIPANANGIVRGVRRGTDPCDTV